MKRISILINVLVITALALASLAPQAYRSASAQSIDSSASTGQLRALLRLPQGNPLPRLSELGVNVLQAQEGTALVLATADQLEKLARLGYTPLATDELGALVQAHAAEQPWLAESLAPAIDQSRLDYAAWETSQSTASVDGQLPATSYELPAIVLSPEQTSAITSLTSLDDDGDGLTNTQEQWWCTDPLNADSDNDGAQDGVEVQSAKNWLANLAASYPSTGKPFAGWPADHSGCYDDDYDSVPDQAERWELGLNMNLESTDRDKFDDGQELFGNTNCPGSGGYCGYGLLPRNEDWGTIIAQMPSWVEAPGNHPMVAAFPVPEVDVVPNTLRVDRITIITTSNGNMVETTKTYSTSKTEGTSTSLENTETWNNWQEYSETTPKNNQAIILEPSLISGDEPSPWTSVLSGVGLLAAGAGCLTTPVTGIGIAACGLPLTAAGGTFVLSTNDYVNQAANYINSQKTQADLPGNASPDDVQTSLSPNMCVIQSPNRLSCSPDGTHYSDDDEFTDNYSPNSSQQDRTPILGGTQYNKPSSTTWEKQTTYQINYPFQGPIPTTTQTHGSSRGGAVSTTNTQYEEHNVTNGEQFSNADTWETATAIDSAHAANLRFTYKVRNDGAEYAREICGLTFNVYLGDDPNPAITYSVASQVGGSGCYQNFMPNEEHTYTSNTIPLSLEQMKTIDLGGPLRVVVEDYSYGIDELFYQDASNGGLLLAMEDGLDDGDEKIETFLLPTWGEETVLDVLGRYFPHSVDEDDNLIAIWTPEYRADTPAWCAEPSRTGSTLWCKHFLSTADWWNVYTNGLGDGAEGFQDTPANPGGVALFRFNQDTDLDGYSDRSEARLGTDPGDPGSYPKPELIAGLHRIISGSNVTATLSLLNSGLYDAYGVEAVMVAPDDTITIENNTVGGSGRVKAGKQVVVGSRILLQDPLPATWTGSGHAKPVTGGYYTGTTDRTYTFTVSCGTTGGCTVGSGTWSLGWSDGTNSGSLSLGTGYASPSLLSVGGYGLKVGLLSGSASNGESFTVQANTPRDTFQYTINANPHSEPVVIVSYNDPQGNHRFVVPTAAMSLGTPEADLLAYAGEMLPDVGVEIVTDGPFAVGANTTDLVLNNPSGQDFADAHLFLEFIDSDGVVVSEVPVTANVQAGPEVVGVTWDTAGFDPTYNPEQDYIVMAFWTDNQGNILDTAARPLSSFQEDPRPVSAMAVSDEVWNFGVAQQGTLMQRQVTLGSVGYMDLLTYLENSSGLEVDGPASLPVSPADTAVYTLTVNTQSLPVGAYSTAIEVRTNDPQHATRTITVQGNVTAMAADIPGGGTLKPLDLPLNVTGPKNQGEWVNYTHTMGPDPVSLHPVKVYDQDYATLKGVGKYASEFGVNTASYEMFGDGRDGAWTVSSNTTFSPIDSSCYGTVNSNTLSATNVAFAAGQKIFIHQSRGTGVGQWEINQISSYTAGTITTNTPLKFTYTDSGASQAQVLVLKQYSSVTINSGVTLFAKPWDGNTGGIVAFLSNGTIQLSGAINVTGGSGSGTNTTGQGYGTGGGFYGGGAFRRGAGTSFQGEGTGGSSTQNTTANGNGAGGSYQNANNAGGSGGSNGTQGGQGTITGSGTLGAIGNVSGNVDLTNMTFGGGGGGGSAENNNSDQLFGGGGGSGAGIVLLFSKTVNITGSVSANGGAGGNGVGACGGGGAGGSVLLKGENITVGTNLISIGGGVGGSQGQGIGGAGGYGRIRLEYCNSLSGSTNPAASTQKISCYIAEQVETTPYNQGRLNLPENVTTSKVYKIQYGRRFVFGGSGNQASYLRMNRELLGSATMNVLVSNTGVSSGALTLSLDIGNNGSNDWTYSATTTFPATLNATNLQTAINNYLLSRSDIAWGSPVDVPVKVTIDRAAQVMLTNLALTPSGAKTRFLRLKAGSYNEVKLSLKFLQPGVSSGPLSFTLDVGADGTTDWSYSGSPSFPATIWSPDLDTAFNSYLSGRTGEVDIPLRIVPSPYLETWLDGMTALPGGTVDASLASGDINFSAGNPTEGAIVNVTATLHNGGSRLSGRLTAAFFATSGGDEWYIGSDFIEDIPAGGTANAVLSWNTLGFSGNTPVRVEIDPYNRLLESSESNNQATTSLTILTRPDLYASGLSLAEPEPLNGMPVDVSLVLNNGGQTAAGTSTLSLYDGDPGNGGVLIGESALPLGAGANQALQFTWTPTSLGMHRLFVQADREGAVNESDEGDNLSWLDVYVGLPGPLLLDSGAAGETAYSEAQGYGYLDEGQADVLQSCGGGSTAAQTLRRDPLGTVVYQFNHLQPGHYYHLDLTLYECDGAGRQESVTIDGLQVAGPVDLGDKQLHRLSLLVDPAFYADHLLRVEIQSPGIDGAVVSEVNLHDIDYRYADAGGGKDPQYPGTKAYGWLDGTASTSWGTLPYQSVRVDQSDRELRYRFDDLNPAKSYKLNLVFWQPSGNGRIMNVNIDGVFSGLTVDTWDYERHQEQLAVLLGAYQTDGSIQVTVERTDADSGVMVNEISIEEETLPTTTSCTVISTPYFSQAYGDVLVSGLGADPVTVVQALNTRGDTVGCFTVGIGGKYGTMRLYGEDSTARPVIPGLRDGELVIFKVNGATAVSSPLLYWHDDRASHEVDLNAGGTVNQAILMQPNWNLISFNVEPAYPLVGLVLDAIEGRYDSVLGEYGSYSPSLEPQYNTLSELHSKGSYYVRMTHPASTNLLVEGVPQAADMPISLHQGWNWLGYLPSVSLTIPQALACIDGQFQYVHSLDQTYDATLPPEFNNWNTMVSGQGYLIYMYNAATLTYPASGGASTVDPSAEDDPTVEATACQGVLPTPNFTVVYGYVQMNGEAAQPGTWVEVLTPRGELAGCAEITKPGILALTHVYGADSYGTPGFLPDEALIFRVNGLQVLTATSLNWQNDLASHQVELTTVIYPIYLPFAHK
jgi:hypothetical protein